MQITISFNKVFVQGKHLLVKLVTKTNHEPAPIAAFCASIFIWMIPYNFKVKLQILIISSILRIQQPAYNFEA